MVATKPKKARKPRIKRIPEKPKYRTHFIDDDVNNKVFTKATSKTMTIFIQLRAEGNIKKKIGTITLSTRTMKINRQRYKHLYNLKQAYGFNDYILRHTKKFDWISLSDEFDDWKIPVHFILNPENNFYLHFKQEGYEKQVFVTLATLEQFKIKPKENRRF